MFFDSWESVAEVAIKGASAYCALVVILRISGKRTLSKMNAFDLVVTVALGSTLATVLTSRQTPLVNGLVALALLVFLQLVVAWSSSRSKRVSALVKAQPRVLFHDGAFARDAMLQERVAEDEVLAAIRQASIDRLADVESVVLESSGDLSVIRRTRPSALQGGLAERAGHRTDAHPPA